MRSFDLVVIGAGPAGCLAALSAPSDMRILLVDRLRLPRDVICGGIVSTSIFDQLRHLHPPDPIFSAPQRLNWTLYDWSLGRGGPLTDRTYFNIDRARFDSWLLTAAEERENIEVWPSTRFVELDCSYDDSLEINLKQASGSIMVATGNLIGADGATSRVRKALKVSAPECWKTLQETILSEGNTVERFMAFMNDDIAHYGWVIPKGENLVVGIFGSTREGPRSRPVTRLRAVGELSAGRGRVLLAGRALRARFPIRRYRLELKRLLPSLYFDLFWRRSMKKPWARRLIALGAPGTDFVPLESAPHHSANRHEHQR